MRIGINPEKEKSDINIDSYHRVVIPVYIPNLKEEYFKDGLKILKICIESLLLTIHNKTKISLINNNCCKEVSDFLESTYNLNENVDQLLHSKLNLGKVNALYSSIKSNLEPLITISDADVMFLPNWQSEVENIINTIPQAGMVSPVPSSKAYSSRYLYSSLFYGLFKAKLKFSNVVNPEGMLNFQKSIGRDSMYNENHLEKYLTIENSKTKAVLGCGHFVATMRSDVFKFSPIEVCKHKIVSGSETQYIDKPNDRAGFLRLATLDNLAYHLGNKLEDWMLIDLEKTKSSNHINLALDTLSKPKPISKIGYFMGKIFHELLIRRFKKLFFKYKGMTKEY